MQRTLRVITGFLIAPLMPAAAIVPITTVVQFVNENMSRGLFPGMSSEPWRDGGFWVLLGVITFFSYGAALLLGGPAYLFLIGRKQITLIDSAICGLLIGVIAYPLSAVSLVASIGAPTSEMLELGVVFWPVSAVGGTLAAIVFWLIARPNRGHLQ